MIPVIFWQDRKKALAGQKEEDVRKTAERESAAVIGFSSAIGAFGAFFIPKAMDVDCNDRNAGSRTLGFCRFYALCLVMTWFFYIRKSAEIKC
jgi:NNP family nitrate/nitrite transporter-like MFS transporter